MSQLSWHSLPFSFIAYGRCNICLHCTSKEY
jgi:hypothetical protein